MTSSKTCFKCFKTLPLTEFYKHADMGDGHLGKCKECTKKDVMLHRLSNLEKIREYDRQRSKNKERAKAAQEISNRWRNEDARRYKCHTAVAKAIRNGIIERKPCCFCGEEKSMAHHESYNNPLDVIWYCQPHLKERHKQMVLEDIYP